MARDVEISKVEIIDPDLPIIDAHHHLWVLPGWSLADAFPQTPLVAAHCGGVLGLGPYAEIDRFSHWKKLIVEAARRPNMLVKVGGLSPRRTGFNFDQRKAPPTLQELVDTWRPYVETCIEAFGPGRCMFESNFDVDNVAGSYRNVWNAFKLITSGCSASEKADLFHETARRAYAIELEEG